MPVDFSLVSFMSVKGFKIIVFVRFQFDSELGKHASEFIGSTITFSKRVEIDELFMDSQIVNLDTFFHLSKENFLIHLSFLGRLDKSLHLTLFFLLLFLAVLDKVGISNLLLGVVSVNLNNAIKFFVRKMEVDSGQDLSELFGAHLLMSMSIPILEEVLEVQSSGHTELVESLSQILNHGQLFFGVIFSSIKEFQIGLGSLLHRVGFFKFLNLEHLIDDITEASPVDLVLTKRELLHK